ncbi:hypothetical protein H1C71_036538 [Ictidomys tridecemlineatus]|nr:hypothetical protein H1C71_036538 [Ictidomys tridecemlineatus]
MPGAYPGSPCLSAHKHKSHFFSSSHSIAFGKAEEVEQKEANLALGFTQWFLYTDKNPLVAEVSHARVSGPRRSLGKVPVAAFPGTSTTRHSSANCITFRFWL